MWARAFLKPSNAFRMLPYHAFPQKGASRVNSGVLIQDS
jgi:hypothetical protein